jgi:spoIIIJ-associated protein
VSDGKYSLNEVGPQIDAFLRSVANHAGFKLKFEVESGETRHTDFENPDVVVKFSGPDVDLLLENKAELLLALEQLTMEVLGMPPEEHSRLCFDANDYRMLRIEELRVSALTAAEKVKRSHTPFHFNPMNSRERRVIHLALRNETAVRSESVGMGPQRQVVVCPADMPTPTEPVFTAPAPPSRSEGRRPPMRRGGPRRRG